MGGCQFLSGKGFGRVVSPMLVGGASKRRGCLADDFHLLEIFVAHKGQTSQSAMFWVLNVV